MKLCTALSALGLTVLLWSCGSPPAPAPLPAVPTDKGPRLYISDETGGNVVIVDPVAGRVIGRVPVGKRPRGLRLSRDGAQLLVALSGSPIAPPGVDESKLPPPDRSADGIGIVDLSAGRVSRVLQSGQDPETFDLSADGPRCTSRTKRRPRCPSWMSRVQMSARGSRSAINPRG